MFGLASATTFTRQLTAAQCYESSLFTYNCDRDMYTFASYQQGRMLDEAEDERLGAFCSLNCVVQCFCCPEALNERQIICGALFFHYGQQSIKKTKC